MQKSLAILNLDLPPTPAFPSVEIRVIEIKIRLAEGRPDLAAGRVDDLLDYLEYFQIRQFRSDALHLKAQALLANSSQGSP